MISGKSLYSKLISNVIKFEKVTSAKHNNFVNEQRVTSSLQLLAFKVPPLPPCGNKLTEISVQYENDILVI